MFDYFSNSNNYTITKRWYKYSMLEMTLFTAYKHDYNVMIVHNDVDIVHISNIHNLEVLILPQTIKELHISNCPALCTMSSSLPRCMRLRIRDCSSLSTDIVVHEDCNLG